MPRALAYTEPEVLRWARESAGYTVEQAAEKIGIVRWQLEMAEEGVDYLTLRQAERAADAYERPLASPLAPDPRVDAIRWARRCLDEIAATKIECFVGDVEKRRARRGPASWHGTGRKP